MKIQTAVIYARGEDIAYQIGAAAAFIIDHDLALCGVYTDENGLDAWNQLAEDSARDKIDAIVVRDMDVISEETKDLISLEELPIPIIGAEDLFCTKEALNLETLEYDVPDVHKTDDDKKALSISVSEAIEEKQRVGEPVGRTPYGFTRQAEKQIPDPDTSGVVKQIFDLARNGHNPARIRKYLNDVEIPTPTGRKIWSRESVKNILINQVYCGSLIEPETFEQVQEVLAAKASERPTSNREPDPFPMVRCDVCNSKLAYLRENAVPRMKANYRCQKHTGESPEKVRLDHIPQITEESLRQQVTEACNAFFQKADRIAAGAEAAMAENRASIELLNARKVALGEKILQIPDETEDWSTFQQEKGLWTDWLELTMKPLSIAGKKLYRMYSPLIFGRDHMEEYDPYIGEKIIRSLRLKPDGTVSIRFWGDELLDQDE